MDNSGILALILIAGGVGVTIYLVKKQKENNIPIQKNINTIYDAIDNIELLPDFNISAIGYGITPISVPCFYYNNKPVGKYAGNLVSNGIGYYYLKCGGYAPSLETTYVYTGAILDVHISPYDNTKTEQIIYLLLDLI
jgi:hypothetical protein